MFRRVAVTALLAMIVAAIVPTAAWAAGTAAGTTIRNQATAEYRDAGGELESVVSNEVVTVVAAQCIPSVIPDGSVLVPGQRVLGLPGTTQTLPYRLTNGGNAVFSFDLRAPVLPESTQSPANVTIYLDLNADGDVDIGEPAVTGVDDLPVDATVDLVVEVALSPDPATSGGTIYVDLVAACRSQPDAVDARNVSRIDIATGGVRREIKRATPSSGSTVAPGDPIEYEIFFTANDVPLALVSVTDALDPRLADPVGLTQGTVTDPATGLSTTVIASYDATTRVVTWTMAVVPAGMTVRLAFQTGVTLDATADAPIANNATIEWFGETTGTTSTNTTSHDVLAQCLPRLGPDGTVATPGATRIAAPGSTAVFPYVLANLGNATASFDLATSVATESTVSPTRLEVVLDTDGDGQVDAGEPVVTSVAGLAPDAVRDLLLVVEMPTDATVGDVIYVDVVAACAIDPTIRDDQNVAAAVVPSGGIEGPVKTADPVAGTTVAPGEALSYEISFTAGGLDLVDVVVTDVIDATLENPAVFTSGVVTDPDTGLSATFAASFDAATRTITWTSDVVPATMTVRLDVATTVRRDALAGETIDNRASVSWSGASSGSEDTPIVTHPVAAICTLTLTPNGTIARPAYERVAYPGDMVAVPYVLTQTGNGAFDIQVRPEIVATDDPDLLAASVVRDLDGDGVVDPGEPVVTTLNDVPAGESVHLLLVLRVGDAPTLSGEAFVDLVASCAAQPTSTDRDNVTRIVVPEGGIAAVGKTSDPASGADLYPGADVRYEVSFRADQRTLRDVVVTDPLDASLSSVRDATDGVITDPATGLSATVSATVTADAVVWSIPEVPSGMTVTLGFTATVSEDAAADASVTNTACIEASGFPAVCTDTVEHPIAPLEILVQKTVDPAVVTVGDELTYTIDVVNPSASAPLRRVMVVDTLPTGLRYREGSSIRVAPDGSSAPLDTALDGQTLTWDIAELAPGDRTTIRYVAHVTVNALDAESLVNTVEAMGLTSEGVVAVATSDSVAAVVDAGVFRARSVLLGRVFIDRDADGRYDDAVDTPVPDIRLFLPDGVSTVTDRFGRYTFQGMTPGLTVVRVDVSTLPPRFLQDTPHQDDPGTWRVRLQGGTLQRVDIPLVAPEVDIDVRQNVVETSPEEAPVGSTTDAARSESREPDAAGAPAEVRTRVTVDLSVWNTPAAESLALVFALEEGERYVAESLRVDGGSAPEPGTPPLALVVPVEDAQPHRISFEIASAQPVDVTRDRVAVVGFFPEPDLLAGPAAALAAVESVRTAPPPPPAQAQERVGVLFVQPTAESVVRDRDAITVSVDMPLDVEAELFVRDEPLPAASIGKRVYDRGFERQTFDWIGVQLLPGPNPLRVVTTSPDGGVVEAETVVYLAGRAASVDFQPKTPLEADSATPIEIELRALDAWGNPPQREFLTVEIEGAVPAGLDARPSEIGYQIRLQQGRGTLPLQPFEEPGVFTVTVLLGEDVVSREFMIRTAVRPPIVVGVASLGVGYRLFGDASGVWFGYDARVFAQTSLADGSRLTVAVNSRLEPLGLYGDPYQAFPVPGAEQRLRGEAKSRHGVYVRWERDLSYAAYGDFQTPEFGPLSGLARSFTGVHARYASDQGWQVLGFAALAPVGNRVESLEIPSDGTSVYRLPVAPVEPGSVRVQVIKRDAFDDAPITDDDDPLTGELDLLVDYTVDDRVGVIRLSRPLPLRDEAGNRYVLVVSFTPVGGQDPARAPQFGVQGIYAWDGLTVRVGGYQLAGANGAFTRVVSAGAVTESEEGRATAEVAYGADRSTGGIGLHLSGQQALGAFTVQGRYEFRSEGFRSATAADGSGAGHDVDATVVYEVDPALALSATGRVTYRSDSERLAWGATLLGTYQPDAEWRSGDAVLGRSPAAQFGVEAQDTGTRLILGASLADPLGLEGSDVRIVHRQGVGALVQSSSQIGVGFRILENLTLRFTERIDWGSTHAFFVGLEQVVDHRDLLETVCWVADCEPPDANLALGSTTVVAQYELEGGVPGEAGRARLGVTTQLPITDALSVDASVQGTVDLIDSAANEIVVGVGGTYQTAAFDADARFEVRIADLPKYTLSAGFTTALSRDTLGSVTFDYLYDASTAPSDGLVISVAGAYRGDAFDLLTKHEARWGALAPDGRTEIFGDTRVSVPLGAGWDVRAGYLYRWRGGSSFLDMIALGTTVSPWDGGQVTGMGRLFHDWTEGDVTAGVTLEASQRIGCGVYGVGGVNLFNRFGLSTPSIYTDQGPYIRLDVVVDEQWRCGLGGVTGTVFGDDNEDGIFQAGERGLAGVHVTLATADGPVQTVVTDGQGRYAFDRVAPGDAYLVRIDLPGRFVRFSSVSAAQTTLVTTREQMVAPAPGMDALGPGQIARTSDVSAASGSTATFEVGMGERLDHIDVGIVTGGESR